MFNVLRQSLRTGVVTTSYPATPADVSPHSRGRPEIDWNEWKDARAAARICPTGAIAFADADGRRRATLDLAKCTFCGLCAEVDPAIRMTTICECAASGRNDLVAAATYSLKPDGSHAGLAVGPAVAAGAESGDQDPQERLQKDGPATGKPASLEILGAQIRERTKRLLGRSLHIREVDAGSCNGCEIEIVGLTNPVYDAERFGVHFVASPRHADLLLVTGPVTRNMELALRKTYDAMPGPRLVVAVGACGCSGGIFGVNYATRGAVDAVIPVDVYVPGCPPNPHALLHGILTAVGRLPQA
jgi:Ni,Fe-hydrogenase III small subunit/ferredoxin